MPTFTLTAVDDDGTVTTKEFSSPFLAEVVEKTDDFLRGVGFVYDDLRVIHSDEDYDRITKEGIIRSESRKERKPFTPDTSVYKDDIIGIE